MFFASCVVLISVVAFHTQQKLKQSSALSLLIWHLPLDVSVSGLLGVAKVGGSLGGSMFKLEAWRLAAPICRCVVNVGGSGFNSRQGV